MNHEYLTHGSKVLVIPFNGPDFDAALNAAYPLK